MLKQLPIDERRRVLHHSYGSLRTLHSNAERQEAAENGSGANNAADGDATVEEAEEKKKEEEEDVVEVFSWCRDTAALFNHSAADPNFAPSGPCGDPSTVWRALRDIPAGEELRFDYGVFAEGGEGQWFAELFPALLEGEAYPDHTQWAD
jgi:hypothetical protein